MTINGPLICRSGQAQPQADNFIYCRKAKSLLQSRLFKFGSSDWTRTSDIRINSPPFYRLNYRGIVVEAYLSGEKTFVKPDLRENRLIADSVVSLL